MDNHHPKKPHIHIDEKEFVYEFKTVDVLLDDFAKLVFEHFGEKI